MVPLTSKYSETTSMLSEGRIQGTVVVSTIRFQTLTAEVDSACGYFEAHACGIEYDKCPVADQPLATSAIEGTCRQMVQDLPERIGMLWSTANAQAMLSIRSLNSSNAWAEFHKQYLIQRFTQGLITANAVKVPENLQAFHNSGSSKSSLCLLNLRIQGFAAPSCLSSVLAGAAVSLRIRRRRKCTSEPSL